MDKHLRRGGHGFAVLLLTVLTFVGGVAWLIALFGQRATFWVRFGLAYCGLSLLFLLVPFALQSKGLDEHLRISTSFQTPSTLKTPFIYRVMNRDFVSAELRSVAMDLAAHMASRFPEGPKTVTFALDGGFPLFDGFPLLPHLSHDDGDKLDLSLYWQTTNGTYIPTAGTSPLGYWGYAQGPTDCPTRWQDLRWDMPWLQALLPDLQLDPVRTKEALKWLSEDPRVGKILVEPHILASTGYSHPKIRFQGCRAARHDDHIHIQL